MESGSIFRKANLYSDIKNVVYQTKFENIPIEGNTQFLKNEGKCYATNIVDFFT